MIFRIISQCSYGENWGLLIRNMTKLNSDIRIIQESEKKEQKTKRARARIGNNVDEEKLKLLEVSILIY